MRIGRWEWLVLWSLVNIGGSVDLSYLKKYWSGYESADKRKMNTETYTHVYRMNKAIV